MENETQVKKGMSRREVILLVIIIILVAGFAFGLYIDHSDNQCIARVQNSTQQAYISGQLNVIQQITTTGIIPFFANSTSIETKSISDICAGK
jgi:hypothetical protein